MDNGQQHDVQGHKLLSPSLSSKMVTSASRRTAKSLLFFFFIETGTNTVGYMMIFLFSFNIATGLLPEHQLKDSYEGRELLPFRSQVQASV